jgi:hypothetical protein
MNTKLIYPIFLALTLLVPGNVLVFAQQQNDVPVQVFAVGLGTIHEIELRATEVNGQQVNVDNFIVKPESVVQIQSGNNLQVFTTAADSPIENVRITNTLGQMTELVLLQQPNVYSLSGVSAGVYVLDIIVRTNQGLAVYETMLVILKEGEQPKNSTEIVNIWIKVSTNVKTIIKFPREDNQTKGNQTEDNQTGTIEIPDPVIVDNQTKPIPEEESPICTPDGPECPPCPEGVEAGWCADEDERQDTDDGLDSIPKEEEEVTNEEDGEIVEEEEEIDEADESDSEENEEEDSGSEFGEGVPPF